MRWNTYVAQMAVRLNSMTIITSSPFLKIGLKAAQGNHEALLHVARQVRQREAALAELRVLQQPLRVHLHLHRVARVAQRKLEVVRIPGFAVAAHGAADHRLLGSGELEEEVQARRVVRLAQVDRQHPRLAGSRARRSERRVDGRRPARLARLLAE